MNRTCSKVVVQDRRHIALFRCMFSGKFGCRQASHAVVDEPFGREPPHLLYEAVEAVDRSHPSVRNPGRKPRFGAAQKVGRAGERNTGTLPKDGKMAAGMKQCILSVPAIAPLECTRPSSDCPSLCPLAGNPRSHRSDLQTILSAISFQQLFCLRHLSRDALCGHTALFLARPSLSDPKILDRRCRCAPGDVGLPAPSLLSKINAPTAIDAQR